LRAANLVKEEGMQSPLISPTGGLAGTIIFSIILAASVIVFGIEVRRLIALLAQGRWEDRFDHLGERVRFFLLMVFGQRGVLRDPIPGLAHFFTFWGFIIISLGTLDLWFGAYNAAIPGVGGDPVFASFLDAFTLAVFAAIIVFSIRRFIVRPKQLESQSHSWVDGAIILALITIILCSVVGYDAFLFHATGGREWSPFGVWFSGALGGVSIGAAIILFRVFWWMHVVTVLGFLDYLPVSKHLHLLATPFNVFFRRYTPKGALPFMENIEEREDYGVSKVQQFTWKQLLDGYACTECGRCNSVCPALATGKPLWPKEIILGVREQLFATGDVPLVGHTQEKQGTDHEPLVGGVIKDESLWACTTCYACVNICPVSIEHVPKIVDMRRHLVMEESRFPQEVIPLFNNMERNQNPWEINNDTRADWAKGLNVPLMAEHPDAEVLYWVGCMASFDQRNRRVATALVKVLQAANVDFAILGPEESCTGDPARRIGNEYLWQMLAQQNIEVLDGYGLNKGKVAANGKANGATNSQVASATGAANGSSNGAQPARPRAIITACPHCFNTIRNEYPQLGGNYEIVHHTKFIERLIADGRLQLPAGFDRRKLTYHDPCYIGRYNDIYDEPRQILSVVNANGVTEMRRNRNRSFCCGGGGGRVWMEEKIGARVNQTRVQEALDTNAEVLAAACPFCITMFEDGVRGKNVEERLHVEDIAEMLARALEGVRT
jgi:Fe-S oxidoreductase